MVLHAVSYESVNVTLSKSVWHEARILIFATVDVVDVYSEDYGSCARPAVIDAQVLWALFETPFSNRLVERSVPDPPSLFHTVDALLEFHDPILLSGLLESVWLL